MARWDEERRWEGRDPWSEGDGGSGSARPGERSNEGWRGERNRGEGGRGEGEGWRGREERDDRGGFGERIRRGEQRTYRAGGREWSGDRGDWRSEGEWRGGGQGGGWRGGEGWRGNEGGRGGEDWRDRDLGQRYGQDFERHEADRWRDRDRSYQGWSSGQTDWNREGRGTYGRGQYGGGQYGSGGGPYGGEYEGGRDWSRRGIWGEPSAATERERWGRESGWDRMRGSESGRDYGFYGRHEGERGHEDRGPMERLGDKMREGWQKMTGRGPKGYKRSDERIREDVCERIARAGVEADDVEVKVSNAEVTLTGEVRHREDKRILEDLAEDVFGVDEVQNQLRVRREGARTSETQAATAHATTPGMPGTQAGGQQRPATSPQQTQQPPQRH